MKLFVTPKRQIYCHLEILTEEAAITPVPTDIDKHFANPDYEGATWVYVDMIFNDALKISAKRLFSWQRTNINL